MSTLTSWASWSASPSTRTIAGSTVTLAISKPAAGTPLSTALTGSDRVCRSVKTGMVTLAVDGVTSTVLTALPTPSIGTSWTSWSTSMPDGWICTSARTAATWRTIDWGPDTITVGGSTPVSPRSSPGGTTPRSTWTGTVF